MSSIKVGLFGCAAVVSLFGGQAQPRFEVLATKSVMVPMRDGVRLSTDIYRPALNGMPAPQRFPVLVERTPYDRSYGETIAAVVVPRGYVFVEQSVRGRYGSEGRWRLLRDDPNDGYDAAQWIASQPWSDGSIGTLGGSYPGGTQHAMAMTSPPALKAMVPLVAMTDIGRFGLRHQGAFELRFFNWLWNVGNPVAFEHPYYPGDAATQKALAALGPQTTQYILGLPLRPGTTPLRMAPEYESALIEAMSHGDDDDYWRDIGVDVVDHVKQEKDVPMHHVSGWYDSWSYCVANLNYVSLARAKKSAQHLTMGPWIHTGLGRSFAGEAEFGPEAAVSISDLELAWMDHWLKGVPNGVEKEGPVRIFVMGGGDAHKTPEGRVFVGGHWRTEKEWPLARAVSTPYYLHSDRTLTTEKAAGGAPSQIQFDPKHPVPSIGGNTSSQGTMMSAGPYDQHCRPDVLGCTDERRLASRNDVLVFETKPLGEDLEVTGPITVNLWASSTAVDTDFTAKLIDVYPPNHDFPDGVELNITDGILRARYRDSLEKATLMKPGQIYKFRIELYPTSLVFAKGHRIRVDVSSSNFPRYDVNPNTGEPLNQNRRTAVAINTVYHDGDHPSHIVLPLVPRR